ncbi:lactate utilization protein [Thioalkalivibrio denitrificans]|uniref:Lactate utilization protein n=1 Tax=Thioalkalivibrio denitrificans TaxID=108003 RepID=A0A1V3NDX9_9GAMM|nr:LUD domain-containing protein [Thioalkalivibrio denitrificans]OOG23261.1 lactate utilization protein [Thioalkalivibrio denitrificans]
MSGARERILAAVRQGLGREALPVASREALDARLRSTVEPDQHLRPRLAEGDIGYLFRARLQSVSATHEPLGSEAYVPAAVAAYLDSRHLEGPVAVAPCLRALDWRRAGLDPRFGQSHGEDVLCVSRAFCAIAETGTLVLLSGPDNPTTLNFLPDHHLVVLHAPDLVSHIEDAWTRIRAREGDWPRTVNLITGPSRTADVEQTIQLGAHGPRSLHVLMVDPGDR